MIRRHLRLLLSTAAIVTLGAGAWTLSTVGSDAGSVSDQEQIGAPHAGMILAQEPTREALDAIGVERIPRAAARVSASAVLATTSMAGLVALLWCSARRTHLGVRHHTILAAAPRGPPGVLWT